MPLPLYRGPQFRPKFWDALTCGAECTVYVAIALPGFCPLRLSAVAKCRGARGPGISVLILLASPPRGRFVVLDRWSLRRDRLATRSMAIQRMYSSALPPEIWTCNLCGYDVRAANSDLCSKYRYKHIRKVHPGVSLDQFHTRSAAATLVEPTKRNVEDAVWQCSKCKLTLPAMDKRLLDRSAKAHLKKCMPKANITLRQNQHRLRKGHTVHKIRFQNLAKAARLAQMKRLDDNIDEASSATAHKLHKNHFSGFDLEF